MRAERNPGEGALPVITLDGPSGVGKSTLAALLAERLGAPFLNTGAMFRAAALMLGEDAPGMSDAELLEKLNGIAFSMENGALLCNGKPLSPEINTEKAGALASALAANPIIRKALADAQRKIAEAGPLVADGRDMGTVIFPSALYKFFLKADPKIRARRRFLQYEAKGVKADLEELEKLIRERDERDQNRPVAPLKPAEDAIIIDTSNLTLPQALEKILHYIDQERLSGKGSGPR